MQVEAQALSVERGGRIVFSDIGFRLAAGESLVVTGPNGAGKSTLLRAIAGLLPLASGRIELSPAADAPRGEFCHYVGHADALKPSLTAFENVAFFAALLATHGRRPTGAQVDAALARLGLAAIADLPCAYLSAGQKRRAALSRLIAVFRPIWLLDEPLTALDSASQTILLDLMHAHLKEGGIVIAATHAPLPIGARELALKSARAA
ncbi:MAG TPA: heme ABC exporter ATP-binding protein CcmA [Methylovirgula sp.]|nr:heme ABC exporter ATP-binding protein CcmA [Methylovirgula sp.]